MIGEALTILETTTLREGRAERARELPGTAVKLADHLLTEKPAAVLGAKSGKITAKRMLERAPDYYKQIAAMRKTRCGGRPKKAGYSQLSTATSSRDTTSRIAAILSRVKRVRLWVQAVAKIHTSLMSTPCWFNKSSVRCFGLRLGWLLRMRPTRSA